MTVVGLTLLGVAGCGGSTTKTVTETKTVSSKPASKPTASTDQSTSGGIPDCKQAGMTRKTGQKEGTCQDEGVISTVVNRDHKLKLKTITARLNGCHQAESVGSGDFTSVANGVFVVCSVRVTNKLDTPISYGDGHSATLSIDKGTYDEDFDAENQNDEQSFLSQDNQDIQPGEARTGNFVFDLPTRRVASVDTQGVLSLAQAGDDVSDPDLNHFGLIRVYG